MLKTEAGDKENLLKTEAEDKENLLNLLEGNNKEEEGNLLEKGEENKE